MWHIHELMAQMVNFNFNRVNLNKLRMLRKASGEKK